MSKSADLLDFCQLVEGFHRRHVVDIEALDFVANLAEHGVVELEERELIARLAVHALGGDVFDRRSGRSHAF